MDLIEFDPMVPHTFTFEGKPIGLNVDDIILLKEVDRDEKKKKEEACALLFVRKNAFIHVDGTMGIRFDRVADFEWLAAIIALTNGCRLVRHEGHPKAFRFAKQNEPETSP